MQCIERTGLEKNKVILVEIGLTIKYKLIKLCYSQLLPASGESKSNFVDIKFRGIKF